jgi:hypothetical protein
MTGNDDVQSRCELGQQQLMRTQYLDAEATLASAEADAWAARDFDTLSRLYMPLQEARRQIRQRCGEGVVRLDLVASAAADGIDAAQIISQHPHGQLLVAGWGSIEPAKAIRSLARERKLYLETFLAAVYPVDAGGRAVIITPLDDVLLPPPQEQSVDMLIRKLPAHSIVLSVDELPTGQRKGDTATFAHVMEMWERLHAPFLAAADMRVDPIQKIEAYRKTQRVDYGCELAHQKASGVARELARQQRQQLRRQPS